MRWRGCLTSSVLVLAGCAVTPGSLPATTAPPTLAPSSPAAAGPGPTVASRPSPAPTSLPGHMNERERSDWYWGSVSDFEMYSFRYDSLSEITTDAHLVVVGRVVDVQLGQVEPFESAAEVPSSMPVVFGVVAIDEVLKGEPEMQVAGQILVARLGRTGMSAADLPRGRVLLFLKNYALWRSEGGYEVSPDAADRFYYTRPNGYQCVLRDIDDTVRIVDGPDGWEAALGPFPSQLDGRPFEEVLDRVKELATGT